MTDSISTSSEAPKSYQHAVALYAAMEKDAVGGVWTGSKIHVFHELGISNGWYSVLFRTLTESGCIENDKRGGGGRGSTVILHHPPEHDEFLAAYELQHRLTRTAKRATLDEQLEQRISQLEGRLPNIDLSRYILSLDERLQKLEDRMAELEGR